MRKMSKIKQMIFKNKALILYLVFGVLTTAVNVVVYFACDQVFGLANTVSVAIAWLLSVMFAFVTNKLWVFESKSLFWRKVMYEMFTFFLSRLSTGTLDLLIMFVAVDCFSQSKLLWKIISNVIVVVLNYAYSKLLIFS